MALKFGELARRASGEDWYLAKYEHYLTHRNHKAERDYAYQLSGREGRPRMAGWSPSGFGSCPRRQQFTYLGFKQAPHDDKTMNIFANGDYVHLRHQIFGLAGGYITDCEVGVELPELQLKGTMDGILANGDGLELKSINSWGFGQVNSFGPKPAHILQCQAYMLAAPQIPRFRVIYENKDTQQLREFVVERSDVSQDETREQLLRLIDSVEEKTFFPMLDECVQERGYVFESCQYRHVCEGAKWPESESLRRRIRVTSSSDTD